MNANKAANLSIAIENLIIKTYDGLFPIAEIRNEIFTLTTIDKSATSAALENLSPEVVNFAKEWGLVDYKRQTEGSR